MNHTDEEAQRRMQALSGFDPSSLPGMRETPAQEALRLRAENAALTAQLAAAEKALDAETEFKYRQTAELVNLEGERDLLRTSLAAATGRLGEATAALQHYAEPKNWTPLLGGDSWALVGAQDPWRPAEAALAPLEKETR